MSTTACIVSRRVWIRSQALALSLPLTSLTLGCNGSGEPAVDEKAANWRKERLEKAKSIESTPPKKK